MSKEKDIAMGSHICSKTEKEHEEFHRQVRKLLGDLDGVLDGQPVDVALQALFDMYRTAIGVYFGEWAEKKLHEVVRRIIDEDSRRRAN
jgi:hypothetical protein